MRTVHAILLFVVAAAPLRAQVPALAASDACRRLEAEARRLTGEKAACEVRAEGLFLSAVSEDAMIRLAPLFPERRYRGHAVLSAAPVAAAPLLPSPLVVEAQAAALDAAQARVRAAAVEANFDNAPTRYGTIVGPGEVLNDSVASSKLILAQGPPGSGGGPPGSGGGPPGSGGQDREPRRDGPPGSGGTPPRQGPPGSGNPPGGQTPPGGGAPPSRPAPVWRSSFPPPAPNWWNTDFDHYDWWNSLPQGYDRPYQDRSNPDTFYHYSGWYRWRDVFVTNWVRTEDTATITRTAANQGQLHTRSLTSQAYRDSKECYYQAVYRYDWVQGGFNGSHWEERFDHYKARCIRQPRQYGQPRVYTSHVSFDMGMVSGQDLPWETDIIRLTYDGTGQPRYDFTGSAYRYATRLDDQRGNSESVTLVAGAKVLRAPEADKVQAFLRVNAGKLELAVNDDRASFYAGETLRVNAKIVRRVVIKVKGVLWGWNEKNVDTVIHSAPLDLLVDAANPQNTLDLTGAANAPKPANAVRSSVFIDSWEFSRVNSRISTGGAVRKGRGNSVDY